MAKKYKEGKLVFKQEKEGNTGKTVNLSGAIENVTEETATQTRTMIETFYEDPFDTTKLVLEYQFV